jgi:AraC-like DNA-binding protein
MPDLPIGQPPVPAAIAVGSHGPGLCRYVLPGLWQLHLYPYACRAEIAGHTLDIRPGMAGITPPGAMMRYHLPTQRAHTYAHFVAAGDPVTMPSLVDCGRDYAGFEERLRAAAVWLPRQPGRAAARLWDVLWEIAGRAPRPAGDDLVEQARDLIELRLSTRLRVASIARQLGISHSQLDRRFRAVHGGTVVGYVRMRRAHLARHLLRSSDLTAAAIARQVGAGDAQALNKLLRGAFGAGPRALRSA